MTLPIKSRHGLTRCGVCRTHIQAGERPSETDCPFCGANLLRGGPLLTRPATRGGVLAASLLAFGLTACGADEPPTLDPAPIAAEDPAQPSTDTPDDFDNAPAPAYGIAPPDEEPPPPQEPVAEAPPPAPTPPPAPSEPVAPTRPTPEPVAVPAYGVAPPDDMPTPAPDTFNQRPSDDMRPTARYGMAPMRERAVPDSDG